MKKIENVAIVGLGALGASHMSKISERVPSDSLRVIASGERASRIKAGVTVNGKKYFFPVATPDDETGPADLLIFAVKSYQLIQAIADARNQIDEKTIIMSLLNGIESEEVIERECGMKPLYSVAVGLDPTREDDSTVYTRLGVIQFGEATNEEGNYSQRVMSVRDFFETAGVAYEIPRDMKRALWKKFMFNVGANQTSAILRCTYMALQKSPEARLVMRKAMEEVAAVARHEGVIFTEDDIEDAFALLGKLSSEGRTSMAQDLSALRKTEVELFGSVVVKLGKIHGVPVPANELLCSLIISIENEPS